MFDGILSPAAAQLYGRLLDGDRIKIITGGENDPRVVSSPAHELVAIGFVAASDRGEASLVATEPGLAQAVALKKLLSDIELRHKHLASLVDGFRSVQHNFRTGSDSETEILTDPNDVVLLSRRLVQAARVEVLNFVTEHMEEPAKIRIAMPVEVESDAPLIRTRTIYTENFIDLMEPIVKSSVAAGEEARIVQSLPHKMIIVDHERALVALNDTGLRAALLTRSHNLIGGLSMLFESVWERAVPYGRDDENHGLTPIERRVLTQLATGSKDEAIAQRLNVTVRTVRRHITSAVNKLGAENRFAAGVLAARRGWI